MTYRCTILGCASSPGVPRITGDWGACDPLNPKNRRLRCSLLVEKIGPDGDTVVVIDTSPDFRQQMLNSGVNRLDGVVYTHSHADHIHGIDDLRGFAIAQRRRIPVYCDGDTHDRLLAAFGYCFVAPEGSMYPPIVERHAIEAGRIFSVDGPGGRIELLPIVQIHGDMMSLGFRIGGDLRRLSGGLAYSPDISDLPPQSVELLRDLDIWIVDALQYRPHISHFSLDQALAWIDRLRPRRACLTHMHIPLDYDRVMRETPEHVEPGYDGMRLELAETVHPSHGPAPCP